MDRHWATRRIGIRRVRWTLQVSGKVETIMTLSSTTIDQIVANVLSQLDSTEKHHATDMGNGHQGKASNEQSVVIADSVVTAEVLEKVETGVSIVIQAKAIVTPAAQDVIRERQLKISKSSAETKSTSPGRKLSATEKQGVSVAIVQHSPEVVQAVEEFNVVQKELFGCPDDAAKFAISEVCRTGAETVLVFAQQTFRAACLANRNQRVKAVAVTSPGDVNSVRKQLRANVWCIDPTNRSYYELRNLLKSINSK